MIYIHCNVPTHKMTKLKQYKKTEKINSEIEKKKVFGLTGYLNVMSCSLLNQVIREGQWQLYWITGQIWHIQYCCVCVVLRTGLRWFKWLFGIRSQQRREQGCHCSHLILKQIVNNKYYPRCQTLPVCFLYCVLFCLGVFFVQIKWTDIRFYTSG